MKTKKNEKIVNVDGKKYCMYFGMICEKYSMPGGGGGYLEVVNETLIRKIEELLIKN
jgi:hypothetical protein